MPTQSNTTMESRLITTDRGSVVSTTSHPVLIAKDCHGKTDEEIVAGLKSGSIHYYWSDVKDLKVGDKVIGY